MDIDPGLLIFLFLFFVLPLIQRVLGGARKQAPPGSQPGQRRPDVSPGHAEGPAEARAGSAADGPDVGEPRRAQVERAADLIPDDLWQILTGERRSPAPSQRRPTPAPEGPPDARTEWQPDAEAQWERKPTTAHLPDFAEEERHQKKRSLDSPWHLESEEVTETTPHAPEPVVTSEAISPTDPARFPQQRELGKAIAARRSPYRAAQAGAFSPDHSLTRPHRAPQRHVTPALSSRSELKRAFVLREVLGPPKALE